MHKHVVSVIAPVAVSQMRQSNDTSLMEERLNRLEAYLSRLEPTMDRARRELDNADRLLRGCTPVGPDAEGVLDDFVSSIMLQRAFSMTS